MIDAIKDAIPRVIWILIAVTVLILALVVLFVIKQWLNGVSIYEILSEKIPFILSEAAVTWLVITFHIVLLRIAIDTF